MYSLLNYGEMLADRDRFDAYCHAISRAVQPGDTVLEIGCGPGVFALLAARAGAKKVYAIDSDEIVHFARELALANALAGRMEFFQLDSRKLQLPERVDVILSDIRGSLPLFAHAIPTLNDARDRLLAPGGRFLPQRDTLQAAIIEAPEFYSKLAAPWSQSAPDLNLSQAQHLLVNSQFNSDFKPGQLLTLPHSWAILDYTSGASPFASASLTFQITRSGTAYGLCLWFDTILFDDIGYSSGPAARKSIYGQVFLPWLEPVPVEPEQSIRVRLQANLVGEEYVWCWDTDIAACHAAPARSFQQSTFLGTNLSHESLRRRAADFIPTLSDEGLADRFLLDAIDGKSSLQQIARAAAARFPKIFSSWEDALRRAADLAAQFSR